LQILYRQTQGDQMESRKACLAIAAAVLAALASSAAAQRAVDGDTIDQNGTRWRLWGIDAPESRRPVRTAGRPASKPSISLSI
jgi:endonuclease YncB( thermonuclease family)